MEPTDMTAPSSKDVVELARVRRLARTGQARELRLRAGLSLAEEAGAVGVAVSTLSRWETGQRRPTGREAIAYGDLLRRLKDEPRAEQRRERTRMRTRRQGKGLTLPKLAGLMGITPRRLSSLERRLAEPSQLELIQLCGILEWPVERSGELLDAVDEPRTAPA